MFSGCLSSLSNCLSVIIVLVQRFANRRVDYESEVELPADQSQPLEEPFISLIPYLPKIFDLLSNDSTSCGIQGPLDSKAFGSLRMKVVELCLVLARSRLIQIDKCLVDLQVLPLMLNVFFLYPWNNLLHGLVESIITSALEQLQAPLAKALFSQANLVHTFQTAYDNNDKIIESGGQRLGYMGHLIRTAVAVEQLLSRHNESIKMELLGDKQEQWAKLLSTRVAIDLERQRPNNNPYASHSQLDDGLQFDLNQGSLLIHNPNGENNLNYNENDENNNNALDYEDDEDNDVIEHPLDEADHSNDDDDVLDNDNENTNNIHWSQLSPLYNNNNNGDNNNQNNTQP